MHFLHTPLYPSFVSFRIGKASSGLTNSQRVHAFMSVDAGTTPKVHALQTGARRVLRVPVLKKSVSGLTTPHVLHAFMSASAVGLQSIAIAWTSTGGGGVSGRGGGRRAAS